MVAPVSGAAGIVAATALIVQDAEAVEMSGGVPAGTVVAAGTAEVAEVEAVGTVEVGEASGHQLLCGLAGGAACFLVSAEHFAAQAQFSGAGLLRVHAAEAVVSLPSPVL